MSKYTQENTILSLPVTGFIRVTQLSILLGVATVTCWRWSANGKIPKPIKLSEKVTVWRAEEIRSWMEAQS